MILDSSAVVAIITGEPIGDELAVRITEAGRVAIAAPSLVECGIVLVRRYDRRGSDMLDDFLERFRVAELPFTPVHWRAAMVAFLRFGKGRHPARLNFGDCLTYAAAAVEDQPLLFIGNDFSRTDILAA